MQTNPNATWAENYPTQRNVNPYTGQRGTKPLEPAPIYTYTAPPRSTYAAPTPYGVAPKPCTNLYGC